MAKSRFTRPELSALSREPMDVSKFTGSGSSTGCCSISGVTCSGSKVITIDWNNRYLTGSIPSDIENLVNLDGL
jgi:hypothetical protein